MNNARIILFIVFFAFFAPSAQSQLFDISFMGNSSKAFKNELKEYDHLRKEHIKEIRRRKKEYKAHKLKYGSSLTIDSLNIDADSLKKIQAIQKQQFIITGNWYSEEEISGWSNEQLTQKNEALVSARDIIFQKTGILKGQKKLEAAKKYRDTFKNYKDSVQALNNLSEFEKDLLIAQKKEQLNAEVESQVISNLKSISELDQLSANEDIVTKLQQQGEDLNGAAILEDKNNIVNSGKKQAKNYFQGKEEALTSAMNRSKKLKKKYSKVIDAKNLSTATKRNSLKDTPLSKRFIFGGTFQIHIDRNSAVDLNPELSYRLHKYFNVGIGGTYQVNTNTDQFFDNLKKNQVIGLRSFAEHKLIKSFYGHIEIETLQKNNDPDGNIQSGWYTSFLAGLERRFKVKPGLEGQVSLLYNFSHRSNPLYDSPWTLRFGFNIVPSNKPGQTN